MNRKFKYISAIVLLFSLIALISAASIDLAYLEINGTACYDKDFSIKIYPLNLTNDSIDINDFLIEISAIPENNSVKFIGMSKNINKYFDIQFVKTEYYVMNVHNISISAKFEQDGKIVENNRTFEFESCLDNKGKGIDFINQTNKYLVDNKEYIIVGVIFLVIIVLLIILIKLRK